MLKIRLQRVGRRNLALYRIVVAENTAPVKGKFIAKIGTYNPKTKKTILNKEVVLKWLNNGVQPSNTVAKLLKNEKISHKLINVHIFNKKEKKVKGKTEDIVEKKADSEEIIENNQLNSQAVESEINKEEVEETKA